MHKQYRKKLSQEVIDGVLELMRSGQIAVGQQVPTENELSAMFHVSRTAVREGIKSLIALGVLETRRGVGTFVRDADLGPLRYFSETSQTLPVALLHDLLEFRLIVEPETAALAAERRTQSDLAELERCVSVLEDVVQHERGIKPPEDLGFHLALARATRNKALLDTSSMISRFYEDDPFLPDRQDVLDHRAILEFVRSGDARAARERMRDHLVAQKGKYPELTAAPVAQEDGHVPR